MSGKIIEESLAINNVGLDGYIRVVSNDGYSYRMPVQTFVELCASAETIQEAVDAWLEEHPEAVTTVQDGSITEVKLSADLQETLHTLIAAVGGPNAAATVADMTDQSKVYVYTGSESGYTAGNWYYFSNGVWVSGGVYNSTALETDPTLSVAGMAADAKATGDQVAQLKEDLGDLDDLETTDKSSIVAAINEAAQSGGSSTGITNAVKQALLACFENVAWATEDGQDYYDALLASMEVPATAISVTPSTASFTSASETQQLVASVTPRDSSDTVTWTSSNPSVATVSNAGLVTPIANGSCTVTATAGNVSDTCAVTVSGIVRSFDVVNSLTHVTNSNSSTRAAEGDSYSATLSADNGYWLTTVVVTMGGEDITDTVYSNGTISIAEVTGAITIYATALEMTIISTNWTRGVLGGTGAYINQKWYGAEVTDMITMGANQTLVVYSTDPNWTTNYTGTDGGGKTGNNCLCVFYQNESSPSYINPTIAVTDEKSILTFSSDTSKVSNYSRTIGARVQISNLVDNLSSVVVGLIDGVV